MKTPYDDIIGLPHHVSDRHPRMPVSDRAAQFSPFAALTGYEAVVAEAARLTSQKAELTEEQKSVLDARLRGLADSGGQGVFTWFVPDSRKDGGAYRTAAGALKRVDPIQKTVTLGDGTAIPMDSLVDIAVME